MYFNLTLNEAVNLISNFRNNIYHQLVNFLIMDKTAVFQFSKSKKNFL